jgi:hypothetical protein
MKDPIVEAVKAKFDQRSALGIKKYGMTLAGNQANIPERITHIMEELMDGALYCQWLLELHRRYEDDGK